MNDNMLDLLDMVGTMKRKAYIPKWMVRQLCPQAEIVYQIEPDMYSFEILYDSVEKFFRQHTNIKKVYIDMKNNVYEGEDGIMNLPKVVDHTTYIIKCSFYK
jgi:hypothetical protein